MAFFVGDSNLRSSIEENQTVLGNIFTEGTTFEQAGSNDALKIVLAGETSQYTKIFIGTILNEIAVKGKAAKTRDEVINNVTKQQAEIIKTFAIANPDVEVMVIPPFCAPTPSGCQINSGSLLFP